MKNEQGFSLVELLIVVAIIAIIAAIAVPSLLTSRMAANEAGAIEGCRTYGSAEVAYASVNNQNYATTQELSDGKYLDDRYLVGFNAYTYTGDTAVTNAPDPFTAPEGFGVIADSTANARYKYGIGIDQVVRYLGLSSGAPQGTAEPKGLVAGDPIGKMQAAQ
jgi:prepilin-type N-terminal cleavage/methylation domain-containing protein